LRRAQRCVQEQKKQKGDGGRKIEKRGIWGKGREQKGGQSSDILIP